MRIYSMISSHCSSLAAVATVSVMSVANHREEIDVTQLLTTSLFQLWFFLLKREPYEAVVRILLIFHVFYCWNICHGFFLCCATV